VPAGRYPPVALCVEVDPHQVDVNVHPTKQLVRFSDEREARVAMGGAVSSAIQGTADYPGSRDEDMPSPEPETSSRISLPSATEDRAESASLTVPESQPAEDRPASEEPLPVPPPEVAASSGEGSSVTPDSLFSPSESPKVFDSPKALAPSERHKSIEQTPALPLGLTLRLG
jgi:DNA mismatch repair protein MutL